MSVKKNLTVATLAALLAVPAFGATNASHTLHIPSVTAHADAPSNVSSPSAWYETGTSANVVLTRPVVAKNVYQNPKGDYLNRVTGTTTFPAGDHVHVVSQGTNGIDLGISDSAHPITNSTTTLYSIPRSDATAFSTGNTTDSNNENRNSNNNYGNGNNNSSATTSSNETNSNSSNGTNGSTQYTSKNSLPQTGENNGASKSMAAGAVALGASASLMALSIAKKHKQDANLEAVTSAEPAVDNGDGKDNTKSNADKSVYNMIMGDTFKSISNDLKQM